MRRIVISATLGVALALQPLAARGQTPSPATTRFVSPQGVAIDDLVKQALEQEPSLQGARRLVDAARARVEQAGLRPNPSLSVSRREEPGGTDNQTMADFEWPLDLGRRTARVDAARAAVTIAELDAADRARLVAADVRSAAGALLVADRHLRIAHELLQTAQRFADLVRARADEGAIPRLDYDRALLDVHRLKVVQALAESRAEDAALTLNSRLGLLPDAPLTLRSVLEEGDVEPFGPPGAKTAPAEARPDVRAAAARVAAADARAALARAEGRLDAGLMVSYQRMDSGFPQRGFDDTGVLTRVRGVFHNVAGGIRLMLPVRNRNQGEVLAIQAERAGAEADRRRLEITAAAEVASAQVADAAARHAVTGFRAVRDLAARNLAVMREAYELGRTALNDVLLEQQRFLEIEQELTELLLQRFNAEVALRRALGSMP